MQTDIKAMEMMPVAPATKKEGETRNTPQEFRRSARLLFVIFVLCLLSFLSAIDATIVTTSLPTITSDIGGERLYVWIANSFLFASTIPQPLISQMSDIFGRRNPILLSIGLFIIGSGIAGGARSSEMLVAGRAVQGLGSAGLYVLSDIICCDLVPGRYRGPYLSAILGTATLGSTLGPIIGGALAQTNWRWIFWLNLPVSGIALAAMALLLNVSYKKNSSWAHALARVDFAGFAIFAPAMVATLFGLVMGGTYYPWSSYSIIIPLVLGIAGWVLFHVYQASRFCKQPSMPPRLFHNRTTVVGFILVFIGSLLIHAINYFLPIYFQAVKGTSPLLSGVYFLPFTISMIFWGGTAGAVLDKTGRYRPLHLLAFVVCSTGVGLFSILDASSNTGKWIGFQILASAGPGIVLTITLPSTLAALPDADIALGTGTYSLIRSLGFIWGTNMAAIIFNAVVDMNLGKIDDSAVRNHLSGGGAYAYASQGTHTIAVLPQSIKDQVTQVYVQALRVVWWAMIAMSATGLFFALIERHVELRKENETDFGFRTNESPHVEEKPANQITVDKEPSRQHEISS